MHSGCWLKRNILQLPRKCCDFCYFQPPICVSLDFQHKKQEQLLSVEDELHVCLSKTRPDLKELCKKHQAQVSR